MTIKLQRVAWSLVLFISLALICHQLSSSTRQGIISLEWTIYFFEWCALGATGLALLLLKWVKVLTTSNHFLYAFIGVANICNAICGAYMLYLGRHMSEMTNYLALLGATLCIGFLILVDILG